MPDLNNKIKSLDEAIPVIDRLRSKKKKIVLAHGVFDLLHYGHMNYLKQAKELGDILVVSVVVDKYVKKGPNRPVFVEKIRLDSVAFLESVDFVVPCHDYGPWQIIKAIKPDVYAKGDDSVAQLKMSGSGLNKDKEIVESIGGALKFTHSLPVHSTELLRNYFTNFSPEVESFLSSFKKKYPISEVLTRLENLKKMKVLIIGEAIIDEYRYVTPLGKANKSVVISAQYLGKEEFAGGALACANHVAGLCQKVDLVTYLGEKNSKEGFIRNHLKPNIQPTFFYCPGQPTIIKRRFVDPAYYSKLFEECIFDRNYLPQEVEQKIEAFLKKEIRKYDLVIVVDYGHGFLSQNLIKAIHRNAKFLAVNAQTNSGNAGFNYVIKYPRIDYACLDEIEIRLATHDNLSDIREVSSFLAKKLGTKKMVVTLGHRGALGYENGNGFKNVPSFAQKVTDPIGAGDAFLAISSPAAAAGFPIELVSFIGSVAASIAVGILGNKFPVERDELFRHISYLLE